MRFTIQRVATSEVSPRSPIRVNIRPRSTEVMGILKSMRDTFKANLEDATAKEKQAAIAHNAFMKAATCAY